MIRAAGEDDLPLILDLGARFHAAAGEQGTFCPDTFGDFCRTLMEEERGALFVSDRGMIGGLVWPSPWSRGVMVSLESFWWAEDGAGTALRRAFETFAGQWGAKPRMGFLHALRGAAVARVLRADGYQPLETIMVKTNGR